MNNIININVNNFIYNINNNNNNNIIINKIMITNFI